MGNLLPERALALSAAETLALLRGRFGGVVDVALDVIATDPDQPASALPDLIRSPVASEPDGSWLKTANIVGVNVRTVGSFWGVAKYALTLPASQSSIHLLPIWEPGVVGSIYGPSSWNLNQEFFVAVDDFNLERVPEEMSSRRAILTGAQRLHRQHCRTGCGREGEAPDATSREPL